MNLLQTIKMVLWSFFGVRSSFGAATDAKAFRPAQVIGVVIVMTGAFLGTLIAIANMAIKRLS